MAPNNEVRHLATNDPQPPRLTEPGKLRVYSMRYCPYAERTLLALNQKGIDFDIVNVNLSNKPTWFLDVNPLGKVPVVEFGPGTAGVGDDSAAKPKRIIESDITVEMLDKMFPGVSPLLPQNNPIQEAEGKCFRALFDAKVMPTYFKAAGASPISADERKQALKETLMAMRALEKDFSGDPFVLPGGEPSFVDILLYPFIERLEPIAEVIGATKADVSLDGMPKWQAWKKAMDSTKGVKKTVRSHKELVDFTKKYMAKIDDRYD